MVFQSYALFPHMTVRENVLFGLQMHRYPRGERAERVSRILDLLRIGEFCDAFPDQLSGGQQQRAALARTLVVEPAVLLLDEPLSALDRQLRDAMRGELRSLLKTIGITTMIVTHDQDEALSLADRVAVMHEGRIVQIGDPQEIYSRPANRFVASFIGQTNYVRGRLASLEGPLAHVEVNDELRLHGLLAGEPCTVGDQVEVAVRPETIALAPKNTPVSGEPGRNSTIGIVERAVFLGGLTTYHLRLPGGSEVAVSQTPSARSGFASPPCAGDRLLISWPIECSMILPIEIRRDICSRKGDGRAE
jgi:ABC-type Fe3+/spermidine/putrescine transport system ATPase subunit